MASLRPVRVLGWLIAFLALAHVVGLLCEAWLGLRRDAGLLRQFDLNEEASLTAWVESTMLLGCALVAGCLTLAARDDGPHVRRRWAVLTAALALMAVDEAAGLHDMATGPIRRGLALDFGVLYFAWLIPALVVVVCLVVYLFPLVTSLPAATTTRFAVAAAVYLGGAVGVEMVSGVLVSGGHSHPAYLGAIVVEETMELVGSLLLLSTLLDLLHRTSPTLTLHVGRDRVGAEVTRSGD